jgi:outer membrane protein OmpA-like peptidoglycan-associated protein
MKKKKILARLAIGGVAALLLTPPGLAADVKGSSDHPLVGRYDGSEIVGYRVTDYDETQVVDGPFDPVDTDKRVGSGFKTLEGRIVLIYYKLPEGRSTLEVLRNYESSLKDKGFSTLFTCATANGSCFANGQSDAGFYLGTAVGDPLALPKLSDDFVQNWFGESGRYLLARADRPKGAVYAALYFGESAGGNVAVVRVVETAEMETGKIAFVTASQMEKAIADTGKIALYGILFDFDKDTLKAESKPTLDEIAKLLTDKPDLSVKIVGHTDNQGSAEYNMDLSERRAANIAAALVRDYGIAAGRLATAGAGLTQPIASNDTEDGRAKNRRVELVAQ